MGNLPPLKAVLALEAVVRTGSVSAAAAELFVTHGAISKQLATLEDWLGKPLFAPNRRMMKPTAAARRLAEAAGMAWALIATATDQVLNDNSDKLLNVIAPATFAMRWLLPLLPEFHNSVPETKVQVRQTHTGENWQEMPFDVVIRRGGQSPGNLKPTLPLMQEDLVLVGSPRLLNAWDVLNAEALSDLPLLESVTRPGELQTWLSTAGVRARVKPVSFAHFYIALEAALSGQGALVAPTFVVSDLLRVGSLIRIIPECSVAGLSYWVAMNPDSATNSSAGLFATWIQQAAIASGTRD